MSNLQIITSHHTHESYIFNQHVRPSYDCSYPLPHNHHVSSHSPNNIVHQSVAVGLTPHFLICFHRCSLGLWSLRIHIYNLIRLILGGIDVIFQSMPRSPILPTHMTSIHPGMLQKAVHV